MDQLNLSEGEDLQPEILQKMKRMPVPDELLNFIGKLKTLAKQAFYGSYAMKHGPCIWKYLTHGHFSSLYF